MYQITNLLNSKIYIGVHKTTDIEDGYMGSGTYLRRAQQKYGIENFEKKILKFFESEEEMFQEEAEIVTLNFINREDTYNLTEGGNGRFPPSATWKALESKTPEQIREYARRSKVVMRERYGSVQSPKNRERVHSTKNKELLKKHGELALTPEAKAKRKETMARIGHQQHEKNSQYGKIWITNGTENQKIQKEEKLPEGWRLGRVLKLSASSPRPQ